MQVAPFSLQLADGSEKHPLGILEDVPIKEGHLYELNDFIIVDITREAYTQIILGRPVLTTSACKIDVKGGAVNF